MAKTMLSFPMSIRSVCAGQIMRARGPVTALEPCGSGAPELWQQAEKFVGAYEVLLPLPDHGALVLQQDQRARVLRVSETAFGGLHICFGA